MSAHIAADACDLGPFGIVVGHATDDEGATGLTVVRGVTGPLSAAMHVLGRATGTREVALLQPGHLVDRVDAILLTGGSAYGLDAVAGVMRWMEERGRGFPIAGGVVPIVPAAVIFDLAPLGRFDRRPTSEMAYAACTSASARIAEGSVGAGTGATVGKRLGRGAAMKGGVGCAIAGDLGEETGLAALAVVNAFGDVRDGAGMILAGARGADGGWAAEAAARAPEAHQTTLAVLAVSRPVGRAVLDQLARAAVAALYRRITPAGTPFDGDLVFAVSPYASGEVERGESRHLEQLRLEALAVLALERAIERAVRLARGRDGVPGLADAAR